ncbi:MAG: hypothetical protein LBJ18_02985 [Rickettsiales bacterium]|jgi:hypothetical protein|nr:hypothetical protein [Rickettsiales bacterium]
MKKVFAICLSLSVFCVFAASAATRNSDSTARNAAANTGAPRAATAANVRGATTSPKVSARATETKLNARAATTDKNISARAELQGGVGLSQTDLPKATLGQGRPTSNTAIRNTTNKYTTTVSARAAIDSVAVGSETRTGAAYEQCKSSYFSCMDQFCALKNDNYKRCSCSDRVYGFTDVQTVMNDANEQLTAFTENLDTVGMTANQASAMRNASEGENALTKDASASKALLQAIMNSIRGEDANVGGKYSDLNSINIGFDATNAFGMTDAGQVIAAYNGTNLYTAIYNQCRKAVANDCNDASLQRAVNAYLMAVEQDCNTVQKMIDDNKKKMTAAVREGGAMLDLARVENRKSHNSDDMTLCLANVESAVLSEEVCGAGYHKCLDNGEFIDIKTGAPIIGVVDFYKLENLLSFSEGTSISDQRLSKITNNRAFVQNFENRAKKFAAPALDKCVEKSDTVWADYLDKAMLDIYYAQKSKVSEIKQGCFDFVAACYMNGDKAITIGMAGLIGETATYLQPDKITLNDALCTDYVAACDGMFDGHIIQKYAENRKDTDILASCRAVAKQCFDKFGGLAYENFFYPISGLFQRGKALDWFSLYDERGNYKSECAKQLSLISSCSAPEIMEKAFGGLDSLQTNDNKRYGLMRNGSFDFHYVRPTGSATEIYYQIIDTLSVRCQNMGGRFVERQFLEPDSYQENYANMANDNICHSKFNAGKYRDLAAKSHYNVILPSGSGDTYKSGENMCPKDYDISVDTSSWGACLCWENGARRSLDGTAVKCEKAVRKEDGEWKTTNIVFSFTATNSRYQVCPNKESKESFALTSCEDKFGLTGLTATDTSGTGVSANNAAAIPKGM